MIVCFIIGKADSTDTTSNLRPLIEVIVLRGRSTRKALRAFKLAPSAASPSSLKVTSPEAADHS